MEGIGCRRATDATRRIHSTAQIAEIKAGWCRAKKLLEKGRDKAGGLMPGWIVVQQHPAYVITCQLIAIFLRVACFLCPVCLEPFY